MTQEESAIPPLVLIVDDEPHIVEFLRMGFGYEGFRVVEAGDGDEALRVAAQERPDVVILDVMLPRLNGLEVARRLRAMGEMAIIMLTARDEVDDRVAGLESGADDYVVKPFAFKELIARVRAVQRRLGRMVGHTLVFLDVSLDRESRVVRRGERAIDLTPREFDLLELFLLHPRQVLKRDAMLARVWGYDFYGDDNVLEVYISHLREKLGDNPPKLIQTVRGVGYVLRG